MLPEIPTWFPPTPPMHLKDKILASALQYRNGAAEPEQE